MSPEAWTTLGITLAVWAFSAGGAWIMIRGNQKAIEGLESKLEAAFKRLDKINSRGETRYRKVMLALTRLDSVGNPHGGKLDELLREMSEDNGPEE
jgi:hypothetical protein